MTNDQRAKQEAVLGRLIDNAIVPEAEARALFDNYMASDSGGGFGGYLLAQRLVSLEQLDIIQPTSFIGGDATPPHGTPIGEPATDIGGDATPPHGSPIGEPAAEALGATFAPSGVGGDDPFADFDVVDFGVDSVAPPTEEPAPTAAPITGDRTTFASTARPAVTARLTPPPKNDAQVYAGFAIGPKLGEGGMGSVYLANHLTDGRQAVVKFLNLEQAQNPTWRRRFVREAEMMRSIRHPNIVELYHVDGDCEQPHIVMEFVDGVDLDEELATRKRFEPNEAARIIRDLARALAKAHEHNIIHRDIKPANVLLNTKGQVKMLDFGLAKNETVDDGLSQAGTVLGTPHYMAPEQWGEHKVDARCDIFSLGATFYQLVTGKLPFRGKRYQVIARKALEGDYPPPKQIVAEISDDMACVIHRCLEPERRFRYHSAAACADDLDRVLKGKPIDVPRLEAKTARGIVRFALLPGKSFEIGRDDTCAVTIPSQSVSRQHAKIERGAIGYTLSDLGSTYGSFVGDMRVREVLLKSGDEVRIGKISLTFSDGGLANSQREAKKAAGNKKTTEIPYSMMRGLRTVLDKRIVSHLLSQLAPDTKERSMEASWAVVSELLDAEAASGMGRHVDSRVEARLHKVPAKLFEITHENRGSEVTSWLSWWDSRRDRYPAQVVPREALAPTRLRLIGKQKRFCPLPPEKVTLTMGREGCDLILNDRSVSRAHATLVRYHQRIAVRDEGSRFGTQINGEKVRTNFLKNGDKLNLGRVQMVFEEARVNAASLMVQGDAAALDPDHYFALEKLGHPSVTRACILFLNIEGLDIWLQQWAQLLFDGSETHDRFLKRMQKIYRKRAKDAEKQLLEMYDGAPGDSQQAWLERAMENEDELGLQVLPMGWFPELEPLPEA
jgi:serine/threonine protein kinase